MQGTLCKQKNGYNWMRVGYADAKFANIMILVSLSTIVYLAFWVYREIPETKSRLVYFLAIYFVAAILYLNLGVWIHEQLHCFAFKGTAHEKRMHIIFTIMLAMLP